jgi:hypothetical protein
LLSSVIGRTPRSAEDLRAGAVVAGVGGQAELEVGVDGVAAGVLQLVGLQLVHQADAPALVTAHVEHDAAAGGGDGGQGRVELRARSRTAGSRRRRR